MRRYLITQFEGHWEVTAYLGTDMLGVPMCCALDGLVELLMMLERGQPLFIIEEAS